MRGGTASSPALAGSVWRWGGSETDRRGCARLGNTRGGLLLLTGRLREAMRGLRCSGSLRKLRGKSHRMPGGPSQWVEANFGLPRPLSRTEGGGLLREHGRGTEGGWHQAVRHRGTERGLYYARRSCRRQGTVHAKGVACAGNLGQTGWLAEDGMGAWGRWQSKSGAQGRACKMRGCDNGQRSA